MDNTKADITKITGFKKLASWQQKLFRDIHKLHNSMIGSNKEDYPVSVKWIKDKKEPRHSYLKVVFKNGEWLHYTLQGNWY